MCRKNRNINLKKEISISKVMFNTKIFPAVANILTSHNRIFFIFQVIDDSLWTGLGLSAVEHIDRVLDEAEGHSHPSPLPSS